FRHSHGPTHPTPSAWALAELRASFRAKQPRAPDEAHPRFRELIDLEDLRAKYQPLGLWSRWAGYWDTGEKAWFEAAVCDRAALVPTPGFCHYWHGSTSKRWSEAGLRARFPELAPYLDRAAARERRPVDACPYRGPAGPGGSAACGLLWRLVGPEPADLSLVPRAACGACRPTLPPSPAAFHPPVAPPPVLAGHRVLA